MIFNGRKTIAVLCAAVLAAAAFTGCASGESGSKDKEKDADDAGTLKVDTEGNDKKIEVYIDEEGTPYFFDNEGNKMMLWSSEYEIAENAEYNTMDEYEFIKGSYDKGGLSFTIPDGWVVDDSYGAPALLKGTSSEDVDYDTSITVGPVQLIFGFEVEPDIKIDKKYIKEYFQKLVDDDFYKSFKINKTGEGTLGGEKATTFDVSMVYTTYDEEGNSKEETGRNIFYITSGDNACVAVFNCDDNDSAVSDMTKVYDSFSDTVKLPTAEQIKTMVDEYSGSFEVDPEGGGELLDDVDGETIDVTVPED